jgi:hypothetical protein
MKTGGRGLNDYQRELKDNEQHLKDAIHEELGKQVCVKIEWAQMLPVAKTYMTVNDYWANRTNYSIVNNRDTVWSSRGDEKSEGLEEACDTLDAAAAAAHVHNQACRAGALGHEDEDAPVTEPSEDDDEDALDAMLNA